MRVWGWEWNVWSRRVRGHTQVLLPLNFCREVPLQQIKWSLVRQTDWGDAIWCECVQHYQSHRKKETATADTKQWPPSSAAAAWKNCTPSASRHDELQRCKRAAEEDLWRSINPSTEKSGTASEKERELGCKQPTMPILSGFLQSCPRTSTGAGLRALERRWIAPSRTSGATHWGHKI